MPKLPENFQVRQANGGGDCFFDSVAQGLNQLKPELNFTVKSLREICKRFAQSQLQHDQSWLNEALKSKKEPLENYITRIEFAGNDIQQKSDAVNVLELASPIWGRTEIEGRIICAEYEVKLHVVEKHFVEGKEIWTHQIVDSKGSRSVDSVDYNKEENMVHVMNTGCLHFQPILKNKVQYNDHSDYNDKIKIKKDSLEVVKNLTQQNVDSKKNNGKVTTRLADEVGKDKQEPQDEEDWYVKNPHAAQTEGYSYEIQLAMWFLLVGKEKVEKKKIKSFYLATDIREAPRFGHIVFKYQKEGCRSKIIFLQAKHKENETRESEHKEDAGLVKVFDLSNAWKAYEKIKGCFSCKKIDNQIFGEEFSDVECSFIFFTNIIRNIGYENILEKTVDPEDILYFGETNDYCYSSLTPCEETDKIILKGDSSPKKEELNEFLGQLKLFFGQPNQKELGELIKQKIKSQYCVRDYDVDLVFAGVKNKIQEWHGRKRTSEFLTSYNRFFEDTARVSIKFDIKEPVAFFTGRTKELDSLHQILQDSGNAVISQTASVTGLGGVGKSELARKYISERSKEYDDNVIWINAENYLTTTESFLRVAEDKLGINILNEKGNRRKIEIIVEEVYQFFAKMYRRSLFVFDNAAKHKSYGMQDEGIDDFLPSGPQKPHVLITSRDQEWKMIKTLPLDVFTEEEAAEFIRKVLENVVDVEEDEVKRLAAELQYMPLALTQAVAYIKTKNKSFKGRFTIRKYLELFENKANELLSKGITENLDRYSGTVMTTWQITIEKIKRKRLRGAQALNILNIIAYLAPDKIPVDVIFCKLINDTRLRHSAVELLDQYSMVSLAGGKLDIHRLVQQVTRIELEREGKHQAIVQETSGLLGKSFPYGSDKLDDIATKRKLLPHLEIFLSHLDHLITKIPNNTLKEKKFFLSNFLLRMADGYNNLGDPKRKKELLEKALVTFKNIYGPNHYQVAAVLINIGNAYRDLGVPTKQKELIEEALKINEDHYGPNHFQVAATLVNLGNAHGDLGDPDKRRELLERALKIQKDHYGPAHFHIATTLVNLGIAYGSLGDVSKQKELLEEALKIQENYYGPTHFHIATTLVNLGIVYGSLGDIYKQKELLERALKIMEKHYGPNNFQVAKTLANLGNTHGHLGDPYKQKELLERALKIQKDHYGPDHFHVAATLASLGNAYGSLGDPLKKKELLESALKIMEDHYGPNHYEVATTLASLGNAHGSLGDLFKKKELLEQALKIQKDHYGPNHFEVVPTLINLGSAYGNLGDPRKQKELLEEALKIAEDHYGPKHFQVAATLESLGNAHGRLGNVLKQKELLEQALNIQKDYYGPNHFELATTLESLGNAYGHLGDVSKQKELIEQALNIQKDHYGPNHFELATTLESLGNAYGHLGDVSKQKELLEKALKIQKDHYGPNHFEVATTLVNLSNAHDNLGNPYKKKELLEQALKIMEDHYGQNHFYVAATLVNLGNAHGDLGNPYKQKELLERALKIQKDHYGPDHFQIASTLASLSNAYGRLGDISKQKELLERALKIDEDHYGLNHFQVAVTLASLGNVYGDLGDPYKQKKLLEKALKIQEEHYGPNHFQLAATLVNLSNAHGELGHFHEQKELLERALKIDEDHYGVNHFEVAATLVNLGNTYGNLGDPFKKKELLERALKIKEDYYGLNHFEVAITLGNLGNAHGSLGDVYKQKELLEQALKIQEDHYGPNHFQLVATLVNLGNSYGNLGDPYKQKELLERAIKIEEGHYGGNHFKVAATLVNLSTAYSDLGDPYKEKELLERALKIQEDHYGPNHFEVAATLANLGNAHGDLGDYLKQKELLEQALKIQKDHYEPDHSEVAATLVNLGNAYGNLGDHMKERELFNAALLVVKRHCGPNDPLLLFLSEYLKKRSASFSFGEEYLSTIIQSTDKQKCSSRRHSM